MPEQSPPEDRLSEPASQKIGKRGRIALDFIIFSDAEAGEHPPLDSATFPKSVLEHFRKGVRTMQAITPSTHEVFTQLEDQEVPVRGLKIRLKETGELALRHKTAISISALTVAGILAARHNLRPRPKK